MWNFWMHFELLWHSWEGESGEVEWKGKAWVKAILEKEWENIYEVDLIIGKFWDHLVKEVGFIWRLGEIKIKDQKLVMRGIGIRLIMEIIYWEKACMGFNIITNFIL